VVLTKREKYIAIGTSAVALLFLLDYAVISPYFDARKDVQTKLEVAKLKQTEANQLLTKQQLLKPVWSQMQTNGLTVDPFVAESQSQHAVLDWANGADFNLQSFKPEHTTQEGKFLVNGFSVSGIATTPALARLLWAVETAKLPMRINDLDARPRKDGTDDLQVRLSVSVLCLPPETVSPGNGTSNGTGNGTAKSNGGTR
jgi:hypothetical protein